MQEHPEVSANIHDDEETESTALVKRDAIDYTQVNCVLRPTYLKAFHFDGAPIAVSWDCGSQNLAYILFAYNHYKPEFVKTKDEIEVIGWEKVNLRESEMGPIVRSLHEEMSRRAWLIKPDNVAVEQQSQHHIKMFAFSYALMMYYLEATKGRPVTIEFVSAAEKFNVSQQSEAEMEIIRAQANSTDAYKIRKQTSIFQAKKILGGFRDERPLAYLNRHDKQDDLAECLTQGLVYMRKKIKIKQQNKRIRQIIELNRDTNDASNPPKPSM